MKFHDVNILFEKLLFFFYPWYKLKKKNKLQNYNDKFLEAPDLFSWGKGIDLWLNNLILEFKKNRRSMFFGRFFFSIQYSNLMEKRNEKNVLSNLCIFNSLHVFLMVREVIFKMKEKYLRLSALPLFLLILCSSICVTSHLSTAYYVD